MLNEKDQHHKKAMDKKDRALEELHLKRKDEARHFQTQEKGFKADVKALLY